MAVKESRNALRISIILFFAILLTMVYQNCGSGGSYGLPSIPSEAKDKTYYLLEAGYECTPMMGPPNIPSHKDGLRMEHNQVYILGDKCNDALRIIQFDAGLFVFSADFSTVTYDGTTYTYSATPPFP